MPILTYNGVLIRMPGGFGISKPFFKKDLLNDTSTFITLGNRFNTSAFNLEYIIERDWTKEYGNVGINNISEFDASITSNRTLGVDEGYQFGFRNQATQSFGDSAELTPLVYFYRPYLINGRYYGWPSEGNKILEIDPENTSAIFHEDASLVSGTEATVKGDKLYIAPVSLNYAIEFDTNTKKFRYWDLGTTTLKFIGNKFVEAPNGSLYATPNNYNYVIKLDPDAGTLTNIGPALSGIRKYRGPILANGKIYGIPYDASTVIEIDPETDTINFIGDSEVRSLSHSLG